MQTKKIFYKNSLSGIIQLVISTILVFGSVFAFNKYLGSEFYGLFATLTLIGNLNIFTNLGISSTLIIMITKTGKSRIADHNIIVSFLILAAMILPVSAGLIYFNKFILFDILNIPVKYYNDVFLLYIFLVISNLFIFLGQIFNAVLESLQKIYITNLFLVIYNTFYNLSIILVLLFSKNMDHIGLAILFSSIVWFSLISWKAISLWGKLDYTNFQISYKKILKEQVTLGSKIYFSGLIFFFYEPLTKILISHFLGVKEVGFWDIGLKIRNQLWGLINKATQPLFPLISSKNDNNYLSFIISDIEQKIYYILLPIVISLFFISKYILRFWIGENNIDIINATTVYITTTYLLFSASMIPFYYFLMSKNHAEKTIYIQLVNAIINLITIYFIFNYAGYNTFIISYFLAIFSSFVLMLYYQKTILNSSIFKSNKELIQYIIVFVVNLILAYFIDMFDISPYLIIAVIPTLSLSITILFIRMFKIFSLNDINRYFGEKSIGKFAAKYLIK